MRPREHIFPWPHKKQLSFEPINAPHARCLAVTLSLCEEQPAGNTSEVKGHRKANSIPSRLGRNPWITYGPVESAILIVLRPYSSFSQTLMFFFHIPSLGETRGTQLEPTSAFLFLFFSLYRQCIDIQLKENRNAVWIFHHVVKDRTDWCQLERNGSVFLRAKTCFCGAASHRRMGEREGDW